MKILNKVNIIENIEVQFPYQNEKYCCVFHLSDAKGYCDNTTLQLDFESIQELFDFFKGINIMEKSIKESLEGII